MTTSEMARLLGVSRTTAYRYVASGKYPALRLPEGHYRIPASVVKDLACIGSVQNQVSKRPGRILVVDDETALVAVIEKFLKTAEPAWEIATATSGFEAGEKLLSFKPDVLVLDLMMPGLDGFQVCQAVKSNPDLRHTSVIAITGYPSQERIEAIIRAGAVACLVKPFDFHHLVKIIRERVSLLPPVRPETE